MPSSNQGPSMRRALPRPEDEINTPCWPLLPLPAYICTRTLAHPIPSRSGRLFSLARTASSLCSSPAVFRFHAFANNVRLSVSSIAHAAHRQTNLPGPGMLSFAPLRGPSLAWHRLTRVVRVHNLYEPSRPSTFACSLNRACYGCLTLDNFRVTAPLSTQLLGCSNQCRELPRGRERVHAPPSTYPLASHRGPTA
jgi:hypothetical protein